VRRTAALIAAATLLGAAACSSSGSSGGRSPAAAPSSGLSGSIVVFAASSLKEAFGTLGDQFTKAHPGAHISFNLDASSTLAEGIQQGQKADVFASASTKNMDTVVSAGDADKPTNFAVNTMEIATPPGNPAHITGVADLAKSGVKVALCDPAVPCGATAQQVFENAKITVHPTASEQDVKSTLAVVETKEVDAGMVYVTDVHAAGSKVHGVAIPGSVNATTTYPIAVVKNTGNRALAQAWVDYVLSPTGQKVLQEDGFSKA
jgi:molybdate transport system substrate-binding protein